MGTKSDTIRLILDKDKEFVLQQIVEITGQTKSAIMLLCMSKALGEECEYFPVLRKPTSIVPGLKSLTYVYNLNVRVKPNVKKELTIKANVNNVDVTTLVFEQFEILKGHYQDNLINCNR